jgi:hypothetical protein
MPHETSTGSSPIVKGLMNNLREILPEEERTKLEGYAQQAEATKPHGDLHRARYCLRWAIETAERPEHSHLAHLAIRMKETHKEWQDIWLGVWFGSEVETRVGQASREIPKDQKVGPGEDVELLWVEEATDVAKAIAEKSGWDAVPWEELLQKVIEIK